MDPSTGLPCEHGGLQRENLKLPDTLITALPDPAFDQADYRLTPATVTRYLDDEVLVDLGDRSFTVLHVPGHSPGGIAPYEEATRVLFSGDTVYDDELIDEGSPGATADRCSVFGSYLCGVATPATLSRSTVQGCSMSSTAT
ncbi:MBL fold metallo-hydrolase [Kribbella sp. VKM Ac-2571]|uniref:MBL fold metallo-hydrolase n=1 Tax=Kribbella sp. VKM Ac-2571 TaxID=2512222 RepID=UPI001EE0F04E|nr:MBL fold metallo-hydrolase [Kribbella sp. VKM Ac-2571]